MTTESTPRPPGTEGLNGYLGFFEQKRQGFYAKTQLEALEKAIAAFKPPKSKRHLVHVHLAELADGSKVVHTADF